MHFKVSAYHLTWVNSIGHPLVYTKMARYFAHISQKGPIRSGDVPGSIGVLEAPTKFLMTIFGVRPIHDFLGSDFSVGLDLVP